MAEHVCRNYENCGEYLEEDSKTDLCESCEGEAEYQERLWEIAEKNQERLHDISEAVLGCREGSFEDILKSIEELKKLRTIKNILDSKAEIIESMRDIENILSDSESVAGNTA